MKTTVGKLKEIIREAVSTTYPETAEEYANQLAADAKARGGQMFLTTDPEHWTSRGVHTGEELARYLAIESYSDAYKDAHGMRPRGTNFDSMTTDEIEDEVSRLYDYAGEKWAGEEEEMERWEREQRVPEPEEFQTPSLTHNPFAGLKEDNTPDSVVSEELTKGDIVSINGKLGIFDGRTKNLNDKNWYKIIFSDFSTFVGEGLDEQPDLSGVNGEWAVAVSNVVKMSDRPIPLDKFYAKDTLGVVGSGKTVTWKTHDGGKEVFDLNVQDRQVHR